VELILAETVFLAWRRARSAARETVPQPATGGQQAAEA